MSLELTLSFPLDFPAQPALSTPISCPDLVCHSVTCLNTQDRCCPLFESGKLRPNQQNGQFKPHSFPDKISLCHQPSHWCLSTDPNTCTSSFSVMSPRGHQSLSMTKVFQTHIHHLLKLSNGTPSFPFLTATQHRPPLLQSTPARQQVSQMPPSRCVWSVTPSLHSCCFHSGPGTVISGLDYCRSL